MNDHLTDEQIERFLKRALASDELLSMDDHLSTCEYCRNRLFDEKEADRAFNSIKAYFESEEID